MKIVHSVTAWVYTNCDNQSFIFQLTVQLRVITHLVVGLLLGAVYYDAGNDASKILSNISCIFFFLMFLIFANGMPSVISSKCNVKLYRLCLWLYIVNLITLWQSSIKSFHVNGARLCLWTAASNRPIIHPPDVILVLRAMVEWYWQGKTKEIRKTCPIATLSTINPTWTDPGTNLSLCGERLVTNHLSHKTDWSNIGSCH
jgi:hypothetical protein